MTEAEVRIAIDAMGPYARLQNAGDAVKRVSFVKSLGPSSPRVVSCEDPADNAKHLLKTTCWWCFVARSVSASGRSGRGGSSHLPFPRPRPTQAARGCLAGFEQGFHHLLDGRLGEAIEWPGE